jgi:hypothetical protein
MFYQNEPFPQPAPPSMAKYRMPVLVTIVFLSFFTRYYLISHPAQVSFDEVHFGHFANNYIDGKYFFDIHPPLGSSPSSSSSSSSPSPLPLALPFLLDTADGQISDFRVAPPIHSQNQSLSLSRSIQASTSLPPRATS